MKNNEYKQSLEKHFDKTFFLKQSLEKNFNKIFLNNA